MKTVDSEGNTILYLGNSGAFVNASDFDGWSDYLSKEIFPNLLTKKENKKPLKAKALDWAVGIKDYIYKGHGRDDLAGPELCLDPNLSCRCIYCFISFSGFHVHVILFFPNNCNDTRIIQNYSPINAIVSFV